MRTPLRVANPVATTFLCNQLRAPERPNRISISSIPVGTGNFETRSRHREYGWGRRSSCSTGTNGREFDDPYSVLQNLTIAHGTVYRDYTGMITLDCLIISCLSSKYKIHSKMKPRLPFPRQPTNHSFPTGRGLASDRTPEGGPSHQLRQIALISFENSTANRRWPHFLDPRAIGVACACGWMFFCVSIFSIFFRWLVVLVTFLLANNAGLTGVLLCK